MFQHTVNSCRDSLPGLIQGVSEFAEAQSLDTQTKYNMCIVVEEFFMNFVSHGKNIHGHMTITVVQDEDDWHIQIRDNGIPFNPLSAAPPDIQAPLENREIGGLGIHFIRHLTEEMTYRRDKDCNVIDLHLSSAT